MSRSFSTQYSEPSCALNTTSFTGPASFASSSVTPARSLSVRMPIEPPRGDASRSHYTRRSSTRQASEPAAHSLERLLDRFAGRGVGEPEVALAERPERGPAEHRHAGLLEQVGGDLLRASAEGLDVR